MFPLHILPNQRHLEKRGTTEKSPELRQNLQVALRPGCMVRLNLSTEVQASKGGKAEAMQPRVHFITEPQSLHYDIMTKGSEGFPPHSLTSFSILRPLGLNKTMEPDLRLNSVVPLKIKFLQLPVNNFNPPKEYPKQKNEVLTDDYLRKILHWKNNYLFSSFFIPSSNFPHYVSWEKK